MRESDGRRAAAGNRRRLRIAVGGIMVECNDFGGLATDLASFGRSVLEEDGEVLEIGSGVIAGMRNALDEQGSECLPLIFAHANSGGPMTSACYEHLKHGLLSRIGDFGPQIDGVLVALHGSAAADGIDDVEGDLLSGVRALVGPKVPIVATLDLHASVTAEMVTHADALLGLETYPHVDYFETGQRAARLLEEILDGRVKPTMAMAKVPVLVGAVNTSTDGQGPFGDIMRRAKSYERTGSVISTSSFLVHPHLDRPEMGSGSLVITNDDMDCAVRLARNLADEHWRRRFEFEPTLVPPQTAIERWLGTQRGPVVLVEAADCTGGGATGDSVATLRVLLHASPAGISLVPVVDPDVAATCHRAGIDAQVEVHLGHALDPRWGEPLQVTGTVTHLCDGRFTYSGGPLQGEATMGPSAVLKIGSVMVLVSSYATYEWRDEQFRAAGLDPTTAQFVVAKNPVNHVSAYGGIAADIIIVDTAGPTPATCRHLAYRRVRRPFFPLDEQDPGHEPQILM